jgi:predicted lipid-binding transport protein (Tim44 family)
MTRGNIVPFVDILIFAVIAVLLVLRLRSVLGQKTGFEDPNRGKEMAERLDPQAAQDQPKASLSANDGHGLDALRRADRSFSEAEFLEGARSAFAMILTSYAEGDLAQLKRLLNYDLLQSFTQSIQQRAHDKESLSIVLEDIKNTSILNAQVFDNVASVTVDFHSLQTRTVTDEDGNVVDDEDTGPQELVDIWTFERDLTLSDPNWRLAETETPETDA